jgi:hypothetical protein
VTRAIGLPVGEAVVAAKPGDGRDAGHPCNVESSGIAAKMEATGLHDSREIQQVQISGKNTPRLKIKGG